MHRRSTAMGRRGRLFIKEFVNGEGVCGLRGAQTGMVEAGTAWWMGGCCVVGGYKVDFIAQKVCSYI